MNLGEVQKLVMDLNSAFFNKVVVQNVKLQLLTSLDNPKVTMHLVMAALSDVQILLELKLQVIDQVINSLSIT